MKRKFTFIVAVLTAMIFLFPTALNAQEEKEVEKKVEKRIKIVTVDEKGEKTVIDTILTGDEDMKEVLLGKDLKWISEEDAGENVIKTKDGNVFVYSTAGDKKFSVYAKGDNKVISEEGEYYMIKKGDKDSFSIVTIDEESADKHKNIVIHIDEDMVHTKDGNVIMKSSKGKGHAYVLKVDEDGEKNIKWVEKSDNLKDGQVHIVIHSSNEVEELVIDGDAVITIKDGKVHVESDGLKMNIKEKGKLKEIKEKKK